MAALTFENGHLLTQEPSRPTAAAMAVRDGKIVGVGPVAEMRSLAGPGAGRVDLGGRTMIPGFNDAHAHLWKIGHLLTTMVDLRRTRALADMAPLLRAAHLRLGPAAWLLGRGYNEANLAEGRAPLRADLDASAHLWAAQELKGELLRRRGRRLRR